MGTEREILINGEPAQWSGDAHTGADLKKQLAIPPDRAVVATLSNGERVTLQDTQKIPGNITEIDTPPQFVYGR